MPSIEQVRFNSNMYKAIFIYMHLSIDSYAARIQELEQHTENLLAKFESIPKQNSTTDEVIDHITWNMLHGGYIY